MRVRRGRALVALTVGLALTASCTDASSQDAGQPAAAAGWRELPEPPISPRIGSSVAWTGTEALFLGGTTGQLCPPNADCISAGTRSGDGAAYNPKTLTWRPTAPAPVDLPDYSRLPVLGDQAVLLLEDGLLLYDASDDAWTRAPGPPGPADGGWSLVQGNGTVIAIRGQQRAQYFADQEYDPTTGQWQALPRDPLVPSFDRQVIPTPHGLLLTGQPEVDQPGSDLRTSLTRAALLTDGDWRALPVSDQLSRDFVWTGQRAVAANLGGADGGQVNGYGRTAPFGGTLQLPEGVWGELPDPPRDGSSEFPLYAASGSKIVTEGWLYDDQMQRWTQLPRPDGAPERASTAVWAGEELVTLGGYTPDEKYTDAGLSRGAFAYRP